MLVIVFCILRPLEEQEEKERRKREREKERDRSQQGMCVIILVKISAVMMANLINSLMMIVQRIDQKE